MDHVLIEVMGLLIGVLIVAGVARRFALPAPLLLILAGVLAALIPGMPAYELDADFVLLLVLPPLLYSAAINGSLIDFRANLRAIGLLSVGYVLFCTALVGLVAWALIPGMPPGAAFALGAVVAPADAVAAVAIARRLGLPSRILTILEGESLVNDATAITALRVASAAVLTGGFSWLEAGARFLWASAGGVVIGLAVAFAISAIRRRLDDPVVENALSLVTPFVAFLPAEEVGASGVVAVVITGLILGHRSSDLLTSAARLQTQAVWRMIDFGLESVVFALIGLQLRGLIEALDAYPLDRLVLYATVVCATVVLSRFLWVFPASYLPRWASPSLARKDPAPSWQSLTVVSWAGMRGVVTLAAALSIKPVTDAGAPFPHRDLIIFLSFCVIAVTLIGQGGTLPWLINRLQVRRDATDDLLAEAQAAHSAATVALARLDELIETEDELPPGVAERLRDKSEQRRLHAWERLGGEDAETPSAAYRRLRLAVLQTERESLVKMRNEGRISDEVLRVLQQDLDLEESLLVRG
jgi:CPA1 family monovalent cation:H+ antiporter